MAIPYEEYPRRDLLVIIIVQTIFMVIVAYLIFSLINKYRRKKVNEVKILAIFFVLLELSCLTAWLPKLLNYINLPIDLIYGIPVWGGKRLWWTNFSYVFNTASTIWLIIFTQNLFKVEKPNIVKIYTVAVIGFNIWSVYHGIYVYKPGESSLTMGLSIYLIALSLYSTSFLYRYARRDISRLPASVYRFGYQIIYISALLSIIAYLYWALSIMLSLPKWASAISWVVNTIVLVLMSLGLTLPQWLRNFAKKQLKLEEE